MSDPDEPIWYISRDGKRVGPLTVQEFAQFEETDRLRPTDQVWQTGMPAWIAYSDYNMRDAATRFARPARASSSSKSSRLHAITSALRGALGSVAKRIAEVRLTRTRDEDAQPPDASETKPTSSFADLQEIIPPSPSRAREPSLPLLGETLVPRKPEGMPQQIQQDRNRRVPADTIKHVAEPSQRSSPIPRLVGEADDSRLRRFATVLRPAVAETPGSTKQDQIRKVPAAPTDDSSARVAPEAVQHSSPVARLASEMQAAASIGLDLTTFRRWVADGRLPRALPDCDKYDLKAIHLALDRMSNIASSPGPTNGRPHPLTRNRD